MLFVVEVHALALGVGLLCGAVAGLPGASAPELTAGATVPAEEPVPMPDPLAPYLARPAPDTAEARRALEALERAVADWGAARGSDPATIAAAAVRADQALARLPTTADWRPLVRAELLARAGDTAAVRVGLVELDPETGYLERWGWRFHVDAHLHAHDTVGARALAGRYAASDVEGSAAAPAWLRAGELALAARDTSGAGEALRRALAFGPESASARAAARMLARLTSAGWGGDELLLGRTLLAAGAWADADRVLGPLVARRDPRVLEDAVLLLDFGRAQYELARWEAARRILAPLTAAEIPVESAAPALYWSGRAALGHGRPGDAEADFLALAARDPGSPLAEEGVALLIERESNDASRGRAAGLLEHLFRTGVSGSRGSLVAVRAGTAPYLRGEYRTAAGHFERYLEASRRAPARQQAAYWAALAHERGGEGALARARFLEAHGEDPLSFYGLLAGERLGVPVLDAALPAGPPRSSVPSSELRNALVRLRVHQIVPTSGSFALELERLTEHFLLREAGYELAEALIEGGFPLQAVVLGRELHRREGAWNLRLLRIVHPFPYRDVVVAEARSRGLDPYLVAGLIRQESAFHGSIRSSAGAVGLMQLMPGTAQAVARAAGIRYAPDVLSDPLTNVRLGTSYLGSMLSRFDGRVVDALTAYNAGPGRIQQWRRLPEYRDPHVFVEHIPFQETRSYVKLVQQYARIYTALYGCAGFEPCLGLSWEDTRRLATAGR